MLLLLTWCPQRRRGGTPGSNGLLALGVSAHLERTVGWNRESGYLERHRLKDEDAQWSALLSGTRAGSSRSNERNHVWGNNEIKAVGSSGRKGRMKCQSTMLL